MKKYYTSFAIALLILLAVVNFLVWCQFGYYEKVLTHRRTLAYGRWFITSEEADGYISAIKDTRWKLMWDFDVVKIESEIISCTTTWSYLDGYWVSADLKCYDYTVKSNCTEIIIYLGVLNIIILALVAYPFVKNHESGKS